MIALLSAPIGASNKLLLVRMRCVLHSIYGVTHISDKVFGKVQVRAFSFCQSLLLGEYSLLACRTFRICYAVNTEE